MQKLKMWIGGQWVNADSGRTFVTRNPATGEEIAEVPLAGKSDVDKAVAAARKAFPAWSKRPQAERSAMIARIAAAIRENKKELARLEVLEHGAPLGLADFMMYFTEENMKLAASTSRTVMGEVMPTLSDMGENLPAANVVAYLKREPIGVCALITPWNVPSLMIGTKLGPCVATGNTCVIKPPSINSAIALKWAEFLDKLGFPPGVINIITGPGGTIGNALASHPGVDLISFTGSCETGKDIIAASSRTVKRTAMELGGKNPVIVLEDVDMDAAVQDLVNKSFMNVGQNCAAPSRFYVQEKIYDKFIAKFIEETKKIRVGNPAEISTDMGPVASKEHRDKIEGYIKAGVNEGANLVLGGKRPDTAPLDKGYFVMPTIFVDMTQNMTIAREEIFGPVVGFIKFKSDEEVMEAANDSTFGLCASVWTRDMARAMKFVNELQAGTVWVNQHINLMPEFPWGGFKESGLGKEGGVHGPQEYTQLKLVCMKYA